jgi:endonuclease-3
VTKKFKKADEPARVARIVAELGRLYPDPKCELDFKTPFQLLVATILSAQCTDKRVNMVTPALFAKFPDAAKMAKASPTELQTLIKTTGFFRNKQKSISGAAQKLVAEFGGKVPQTMDELTSLPGVARKTANVILGTAFGRNDGFVVDTHVGRLSRRLGLTKEEDPVKVERDMCRLVPQNLWTETGHQLILHGRRVCNARDPACERCTLAADCPSAKV